MKEHVYEYVIKNYCFDNFHLKDIQITQPAGLFKTVHRDFELIVFTSKKIMLFANITNDVSDSDATIILKGALNTMVNKLKISPNNFVLCGTNKTFFYYLNIYNDRLMRFELQSNQCLKVVDYIENEMIYGSDVYDYNQIRKMYDVLCFSSENKTTINSKEKTYLSTDGKLFVKKHGAWKEASNINTEKLYLLTVFGGMFGLHLFYQKKRTKGVLYLLTFGMFGVGWFFDSLEILFGIYKDLDGKYLKPLNNKLIGFLLLLAGMLMFFVFGKILLLLFEFLFVNIGKVLSSIIINS